MPRLGEMRFEVLSVHWRWFRPVHIWGLGLRYRTNSSRNAQELGSQCIGPTVNTHTKVFFSQALSAAQPTTDAAKQLTDASSRAAFERQAAAVKLATFPESRGEADTRETRSCQ